MLANAMARILSLSPGPIQTPMGARDATITDSPAE
jgi:hypothetical protein